MGDLRQPGNVSYDRNSGLPTGRESYGNGVTIVIVEVTSYQGERESRLQGVRHVTDYMDYLIRGMRKMPK